MSELREVRCPECKKLLFRASGNYDIEILCTGAPCKAAKDRVKRLTYPHPLSFNSPTPARAQKTREGQNVIERQSQKETQWQTKA